MENKKLTSQRLSLTHVAHAINKIFAGADREQIDVP